MPAIVSMKVLLESGAHFGHRTNKWDPRMKPYIFTERNGIHIIDLQQTVKLLTQAYHVVRDTVAAGGIVLFVGTKRQAKDIVREEAIRCGMPYVTERWLGGTLTNWSTIYQRIQELKRLERMVESGEIQRLTKKEGLLIQREIKRLQLHLEGIRDMERLPDMLFVVDVCEEEIAVREANILNIPVVALVDTNCNPLNVDYIIPANDDAVRSIRLLSGKIADAVLEGKAMRKEEVAAASPVARTQAKAAVERARVATPMLLDEEELEDEDLLGESTLAKIGPRKMELDQEAEEEDEEEV